MNGLQALIFDVDGTLADTERDGHRAAFNAAFKDNGLDWRWDVELYGRLLAVTGGKERIRYYLDEFNGACPYQAEPDGFIARLHKDKTRHYTGMLRTGRVPLRPGVERLITEARESGTRLAIATTTTPENVTALLEHSLPPGSSDWFEVIAAGDVVPAKKPAPDIYHYALEQLGLAPEQCMAFEDSRNGILASRGAGLETVIAVNGYTRDDDFDGALLVVDHLGEPDHPFTVLEGDAKGADYLDLDLLQRLHG